MQQWRHTTRNPLPPDDALFARTFDVGGDAAIFIRNQENNRDVFTYRCGLADQSFIGHDRHIALDPILFAAVNSNSAPPGGGIARYDFGRHKFKHGAFASVLRVTQSIYL